MIDEGSVRESFNMMIKSIVVMTTGELVNHHHGQVRHLPALVLPVKEVPYTVNGKKVVKSLNMVLIQFGTKLKKCWFKPFEELLTIRCLKGGSGNQEDTKRSGGKFLAAHPALSFETVALWWKNDFPPYSVYSLIWWKIISSKEQLSQKRRFADSRDSCQEQRF